MTLNFLKHHIASEHCTASTGIGITCGRDSLPGDNLCHFHRTLFGPWFKAAVKKAA